MPREFSAHLAWCNAWGPATWAMSSRPHIVTTYVQRAERGTKPRSAPIAGRSASVWRRPPAAAVCIVLGGDCSIVLGSLLGARKSAQGSVGLVYIDAHADFGTPEESHTGSVASMCLALAVGRGETPLARLTGDAPLVHGKDVVLIGRRDAAEPWYGHAALAASPILDIPGAALSDRGVADVAAAALKRLTSPGPSEEPRGFWIHLDADVINPSVMPAVDSPEPGGPTIEELANLLTPLARHPRALGLELTIYDPGLDPDAIMRYSACGVAGERSPRSSIG